MHLLYPFARRFIAGEDLPTALAAIDRLYEVGYQSTIDVLGENVKTATQATMAKEAYLDLLHTVRNAHHLMDFSIKLTQMGLDIDTGQCTKNLEEILTAAAHHTVRFDIEGSVHTQLILDQVIKLHGTFKNLGQALQAYLFRTEKDLNTMIEKGISVRLCKGAYKEPPSISWQSMDDIRESYLKLARKLLKEGFLPAIATHDEYLLTQILSFVRTERVDPSSFYFEMLYGVRRDLQKLLLDKGYQVRIYVPYGKSWLPYTLRRLTEKKENIFFVLKHLYRETFGIHKLH